VTEPEADHGDLHTGSQEGHGAGVPQNMRSQLLGSDRRGLLGREHLVDSDASLDCIVTEASPGPSREEGIVGEATSLAEPNPQDGDRAGRQGNAALLTTLSKACLLYTSRCV